MKKEPVSLKDIAKQLNVSISTVSRALRNKGEINPETRKGIIELAKKLKFRPNPLATGLLNKKTSTIGIVIPEIENYFYSTILRGMDSVASLSGYRLIVSYTNDNQTNEILAIQELMLSRVDGIIACPSSELYDFTHYYDIIDNNIPLVIFEREPEEIPTYKVVTDNIKSSIEVTEHLISKRCRRIAFITNLEPLAAGRLRYEGYKMALKKHNIPLDHELIIHGNMNISTSVEATINLLKKKPLPDAIIGNNDMVAMVAMKIAKEKGFRIPQDIAVAGFADEPFSSFLEPSLTSVGQPAYLIGMKSLEIMLQMINGDIPINEDKKIVLESALVIRDSTKR